MSLSWPERIRGTFGFQLALRYALLFVAGASVLSVLSYWQLASSLRSRDHELIRDTLDHYVYEYQRAGLSGLRDAIGSDRVAGRHERLFVRVLGRQADAVFLNTPADWEGADLDRLAPDASGWARLPARDAGAILEVASVRLPDGTLLQVGKSSESRAELLGRLRDLSALLLGGIVVIAGLGSAALTWSALRPVRELATAVRRIVDTGETSSRVPVRDSGDPLDDLSRLFNGMLERIEALIAGLEGSLDNVAHDLRTPLARLRANAETALTRGSDAAAYRAALEDCLEESERVHETLTALLDVSEAEHGAMRLRRESVDIASLLRDAAELYEDVAGEKKIGLAVSASPGLCLTGDRARLRQALANLLDNAIKYTPSGGHVKMMAVGRPGIVAIEVHDDGPGIPQDDQPRIFDRLYRADQSRSQPGLGLGLSLVRAIVRAHGGSISLVSAPGQGSKFRIELPATDSITQL
jgi:signal transduction histidine kinase